MAQHREQPEPIRVNRAPVLTLWAAIVAEQLGHPWETALTLGRAVAGSSAQAKARRLGIAEEKPGGKEADLAQEVRREAVPLLGRQVPVITGRDGKVYALDHDKPASPASVRSYIERAFGDRLPEVCKAMEDLARSIPPEELNRLGFRLYEHFRPEVPDDVRGWGAKGILRLDRIRAAKD
jgi:hypothetical protein